MLELQLYFVVCKQSKCNGKVKAESRCDFSPEVGKSLLVRNSWMREECNLCLVQTSTSTWPMASRTQTFIASLSPILERQQTNSLEEYSEHVIVVSNIFLFHIQDDHPQLPMCFLAGRLKSPASHLLGCLGILRSGITHRATKQAHEKICVCLFT